MNYRPSPLLYGANEDFLSTFKLVIVMNSPIDHAVLSHSVAKAMERYPYFCISVEKEGNEILLRSNPRPVTVFDDDRCVILGSEESNRHLISFGCKDNKIILNASHYIADGMGIIPVVKTVLYLYTSAIYGDEGFDTANIRLPGDPVPETEYAYPFPDKPIDIEPLVARKPLDEVYTLDGDAFDGDGLYAYHLRVPQKLLMSKANTTDGSPVSFFSVLLYRALCRLDSELDLPVVAHVQHQYRAALRAPMTHDSIVRYIPATLPPRVKSFDVELQNTVFRGQIIIESEPGAAINSVNQLLMALPDGEEVSLEDKMASMSKYVNDSISKKTFGISYVGRMDWSGLERYVEDMHAYIGEKQGRSMLLIEVSTIGEDFSLNFMQSGRGERYVEAFADQLRELDIPIRIVGEDRYTLCPTRI